MGLVPEEIVEEIRQSSDIYTVVSDYLRLKKQGRNYVGLCPFHNEKTPSFTVSPEKQIYYCFGCGAGGNVISFIMQIENLNFPEALRFLADKSGVVIPEEVDKQEESRLKERDRAFKLNELAKDFYCYILSNQASAEEARRYLDKRGIDKATREAFQIGFAPPAWDNLLKFLQKKGYSPDYLESQGVVLKKHQGTGYYDRFRQRVIFPIWDHKNNVIGFGGRVLDNSLPKYLNSPETVVFNKSTNLYGINFAIPAIREAESVIIVEGYLDVITCHQFGIKNVVASLGTAMTKEQGKILARYAHTVYIAYDSDNAGVAATMRGLEILQDTGCRVKVVTIPQGKDPDELIRKKGPESFRRLIAEKSKSLIEYKLEKAMEKFDYATVEGKIGIVSEVVPSLVKLQSEIEKEEQIKHISSTVGISSHALWGEIRKYQQKTRKNVGKRDKITVERNNTIDKAKENSGLLTTAGSGTTRNMGARARAEESLIKLLAVYPQFFLRVKEELGVKFTDHPEYLIIINYLSDLLDAGRDFEPAALLNRVTDEEQRKRISALLVEPEPPGDPEAILKDYIKVINETEVKSKREQILQQLEEAEQANNVELRNKLLQEFTKLI